MSMEQIQRYPMSSESEQYKQMLVEEGQRRYQDRLDARAYVLKHWEDGDDRDEILEALGLTEEQLSKNLDWNEGQSLSRGGLGSSMGKFSTPRTPPSRAQ